MGLVKSLWVVGGENPSHRGEEWAKLVKIPAVHNDAVPTNSVEQLACRAFVKISQRRIEAHKIRWLKYL